MYVRLWPKGRLDAQLKTPDTSKRITCGAWPARSCCPARLHLGCRSEPGQTEPRSKVSAGAGAETQVVAFVNLCKTPIAATADFAAENWCKRLCRSRNCLEQPKTLKGVQLWSQLRSFTSTVCVSCTDIHQNVVSVRLRTPFARSSG